MGTARKETGYLTTHGPAGEEIRVPVATACGSSDGPTLVVVAGVHGSEYDGIEATKRLFAEVDPGQLSGRLVTIPCLSVPAFYGLAMHINPADGQNPGGAWPGDPRGSYTERMTELVWSAHVRDADFVIDVHGGDLEEELVEYSQVEIVGDDRVDTAGEALARALDMPFFVRRPARPATDALGALPLMAASSGIPGVLVEAGSHGVLDEVATTAHLQALRNALRHTDMLPGELRIENPEPTELIRFVGVPAPVEGFWYPDVVKGDIIRRGQRLGTMRDFFGETLAEVTSDENAAILGVMTIPPRRRGDMLMGLGTLD